MKYFTFDEAEAMIPQLEKIFSVVVEIRTKAEIKIRTIQNLEKQEKLEVAQLAIEKSQIEFLAQSLEEAISEVEKMGAVLKGLDPALVDFPFKLNGEEVYLCWKFGEKEIQHYHGTEEGFAARKSLPRNLLLH